MNFFFLLSPVLWGLSASVPHAPHRSTRQLYFAECKPPQAKNFVFFFAVVVYLLCVSILSLYLWDGAIYDSSTSTVYCGAKASENDWRILSIMRLSYDSKVAANICQPLIVVIPAVEGNTNFDLILSCSIFFSSFLFLFYPPPSFYICMMCISLQFCYFLNTLHIRICFIDTHA